LFGVLIINKILFY